MKIRLKDFQEDAINKLVGHLRSASREAGRDLQAITLSSPTGSGKTIIATASIERIIKGDAEYAADDVATFVWLSDQPEINEQTRRKMLETSDILDGSRLVTVDPTFDEEFFRAGRVYFLNIQKLGKDKQLVTRGDDRSFTIWETITNTIHRDPTHFFLFIDEAHRGMRETNRDQKEASTIVQKFVKGSESEIPPIPIIVGISATPERFDSLVQGTSRIKWPVPIPIEAVRASGLLKDAIRLYYPTENQPTDMTMLTAAVQTWQAFASHWEGYCKKQREPVIRPILMVQVQDGSQGKISNTDLDAAITAINETAGFLAPDAFAHSFQEGSSVELQTLKLRYLAPPDVSSDSNVKVVFFKTSLNTGWDCPRAEVMMSFRRALDSTSIAQLVGRMVRTPLARKIGTDEFLNTVALYLPHYDQAGLQRVVDKLTSPDFEDMPPVEVERGEEYVTLTRRKKSEDLFAALSAIPSYVIPKARKVSEVRRLMRLARLLANDEIEPSAVEDARKILLKVLQTEYSKLKRTRNFRTIVESKGKVKVKAVDWLFSGQLKEGDVIELDIAKQNLEELFEDAGRKLGEGLHKYWWRERVELDEDSRVKAKLEVVALSMAREVLSRVERTAQTTVQSWLEKYRTNINALTEGREQGYNEVRESASEPEVTRIDYPENISVKRGTQLVDKHLYVDEKDQFPTTLNAWETKVIQSETEKAIGWLRNLDRKDWSFTIPYRQAEVIRPLYPDFLVVRQTSDGPVVDLIDPHSPELGDAPAKAKGLAEYAAKHAHRFGRIELTIVEGEAVKRLNLKDEKTRKKVMAATTREQLLQLYEEAN